MIWQNGLSCFYKNEGELSYLNKFITTRSSLNNGEIMEYARGVFVSPYKNHRTINHSGRDLGMRSQLICLPDEDLAVIIYSNSEHINAVNLSYKIIDMFLISPQKTEEQLKEYVHGKSELLSFSGRLPRVK